MRGWKVVARDIRVVVVVVVVVNWFFYTVKRHGVNRNAGDKMCRLEYCLRRIRKGL